MRDLQREIEQCRAEQRVAQSALDANTDPAVSRLLEIWLLDWLMEEMAIRRGISMEEKQ